MRHCLVMAYKVAKCPFVVNNIITNQGVTPYPHHIPIPYPHIPPISPISHIL